MASPSPSPVVRFSANTDRSTKPATIRRARNVHRIASPPSKGGSSAATSERKNSSESRKTNGNASNSERARSWLTCVLTCALATCPPPSLTYWTWANRSSICWASFLSRVSDSGLK